jgi:hypothetical protein
MPTIKVRGRIAIFGSIHEPCVTLFEQPFDDPSHFRDRDEECPACRSVVHHRGPRTDAERV